MKLNDFKNHSDILNQSLAEKVNSKNKDLAHVQVQLAAIKAIEENQVEVQVGQHFSEAFQEKLFTIIETNSLLDDGVFIREFKVYLKGVEELSGENQTEVHQAIYKKLFEIVDHILGLLVNFYRNREEGSIVEPIKLNEKLENLIQQFPDIMKFQDEEGKTLFHKLLDLDLGDALRFCCRESKKIADENHSCDPYNPFLSIADENDSYPLHLAAVFNKVDEVKCMLKSGAFVDAAGMGGVTALYYATFYKHWAMVQILIEAGASVQDLAINHKPIISVAYEYYLTNVSFDETDSRKSNAISAYKVVEQLIQTPGIINHESRSSDSFFDLLVINSDWDLIFIVIASDLNYANYQYENLPLYCYAIQEYELDVLKHLFNMGADLSPGAEFIGALSYFLSNYLYIRRLEAKEGGEQAGFSGDPLEWIEFFLDKVDDNLDVINEENRSVFNLAVYLLELPDYQDLHIKIFESLISKANELYNSDTKMRATFDRSSDLVVSPIAQAITHGCFEAFILLYSSQKIDLAQNSNTSESLFFLACRYDRDGRMLMALLDDKQVKDNPEKYLKAERFNVFNFVAVYCNQVAMKVLIENKIVPNSLMNIPNYSNLTALDNLLNTDVENYLEAAATCFELLVRNGADTRTIVKEKTLLIRTIEVFSSTEVRLLINLKKVSINVPDRYGNYPLAYAMKRGWNSKEDLELLIPQEADLSTWEVISERAALYYAAASGCTSFLEVWRDRGLDINQLRGDSHHAIEYAINAHQWAFVKRLLQLNPALKDYQIEGIPLIQIVILDEPEGGEVFAHLWPQVMDLTQKDAEGNTTLHRLCQVSHHKALAVEMIQDRILQIQTKSDESVSRKKVSLSAKNQWGMTPLGWAARYGQWDLVCQFAEYPKLMSKVIYEGLNILEIAIKTNAGKFIENLLKHKHIQKMLDLKKIDDNGKNILHQAARSGSLSVLLQQYNLLFRENSLNQNEDWDKSQDRLKSALLLFDKENNTPFHLAVIENQPKAVKEIVEVENLDLDPVVDNKDSIKLKSDSENEEGNVTPSVLALQLGHWNCLKYLIVKGIDVNYFFVSNRAYNLLIYSPRSVLKLLRSTKKAQFLERTGEIGKVIDRLRNPSSHDESRIRQQVTQEILIYIKNLNFVRSKEVEIKVIEDIDLKDLNYFKYLLDYFDSLDLDPVESVDDPPVIYDKASQRKNLEHFFNLLEKNIRKRGVLDSNLVKEYEQYRRILKHLSSAIQNESLDPHSIIACYITLSRLGPEICIDPFNKAMVYISQILFPDKKIEIEKIEPIIAFKKDLINEFYNQVEVCFRSVLRINERNLGTHAYNFALNRLGVDFGLKGAEDIYEKQGFLELADYYLNVNKHAHSIDEQGIVDFDYTTENINAIIIVVYTDFLNIFSAATYYRFSQILLDLIDKYSSQVFMDYINDFLSTRKSENLNKIKNENEADREKIRAYLMLNEQNVGVPQVSERAQIKQGIEQVEAMQNRLILEKKKLEKELDSNTGEALSSKDVEDKRKKHIEIEAQLKQIQSRLRSLAVKLRETEAIDPKIAYEEELNNVGLSDKIRAEIDAILDEDKTLHENWSGIYLTMKEDSEGNFLDRSGSVIETPSAENIVYELDPRAYFQFWLYFCRFERSQDF